MNTRTQAAAKGAGIGMKKRSLLYKIKDNSELLLLTAPAILFFVIFRYLPMLGIVIAFKDYTYEDGIFGSRWIGFDNFKFFFTSQDAIRITRNTVAYGVTFIIVGMIAAVLVALLLFEIRNRHAVKFYQTAMILPNFMSWVVVGYITYILFNPVLGVLNRGLEAVGLSGVDWYSEPKYWPVILTITNVWKKVGMDSVIYYAALMGVNHELYEAATLDGANVLQKARYISIPEVVPVAVILGILAVGNIFRGDFGLFYQIPRDVGALYPTTDIIDTYVYRGLRTGDMGVTTAVGLFQSVVGVILVVATNAIVKKIEPEQALWR